MPLKSSRRVIAIFFDSANARFVKRIRFSGKIRAELPVSIPGSADADSSQQFDEIGEILRPQGFEAQFDLPGGMKKTEYAGVQSLAREFGRRAKGGLLLGCFGARRLATAAIDRIADQRMADMGEMHANLMRAARLQPEIEQ